MATPLEKDTAAALAELMPTLGALKHGWESEGALVASDEQKRRHHTALKSVDPNLRPSWGYTQQIHSQVKKESLAAYSLTCSKCETCGPQGFGSEKIQFPQVLLAALLALDFITQTCFDSVCALLSGELMSFGPQLHSLVLSKAQVFSTFYYALATSLFSQVDPPDDVEIAQSFPFIWKIQQVFRVKCWRPIWTAALARTRMTAEFQLAMDSVLAELERMKEKIASQGRELANTNRRVESVGQKVSKGFGKAGKQGGAKQLLDGAPERQRSQRRAAAADRDEDWVKDTKSRTRGICLQWVRGKCKDADCSKAHEASLADAKWLNATYNKKGQVSEEEVKAKIAPA